MGSFANGSDYRCRFGAAVSTTQEAPDALQVRVRLRAGALAMARARARFGVRVRVRVRLALALTLTPNLQRPRAGFVPATFDPDARLG